MMVPVSPWAHKETRREDSAGGKRVHPKPAAASHPERGPEPHRGVLLQLHVADERRGRRDPAFRVPFGRDLAEGQEGHVEVGRGGGGGGWGDGGRVLLLLEPNSAWQLSCELTLCATR